MTRRYGLSEAEKDQVWELRAQGMSERKIGHRLGLLPVSVSRYLASVGNTDMWCGSPRMGRHWPGKPVCSIFVVARCAGCPPRSSAAASVTRNGLARSVFGSRIADRARPVVGAGGQLPGPEAALALVGAARRLGVSAKAREVRGADRVVVRDGEAIGALLTRMGAQDTRLTWEERRMRREVRATANRLANFDDANLRRSARAAVAAAARVERALEILGDTVPDHLAAAGKLRVEHRQASLEELGRLADPPMTKDAVAGRIRRLLSMADRKAKQEGIPDTESAVTPDLLDDA